MADSYDVTLSVKVVRASDKSIVVEEANYFNSLSFGLMAEKAAAIYELITKLLKK